MINDPVTVDINPVLDDIMRRIGPMAHPEDVDLIRMDAKECLNRGWLPNEIIDMARCTEQVDNTLDEDVALARMRAIAERVYKRAPSLNKTNT